MLLQLGGQLVYEQKAFKLLLRNRLERVITSTIMGQQESLLQLPLVCAAFTESLKIGNYSFSYLILKKHESVLLFENRKVFNVLI